MWKKIGDSIRNGDAVKFIFFSWLFLDQSQNQLEYTKSHFITKVLEEFKHLIF